jgi:GTP-binding protein Era
VIERLQKTQTPVLLLINKIDLATQEQVDEKIQYWKENFKSDVIIPISALADINVKHVFKAIVSRLPVHPPYFPKDELTDRPERFFASEIIREKIFLNYKKEVPYSCEVIITGFKEKEDIIVVQSEILVERATQRAILLGEGGKMIKKTGIMAREELERFFGKKVFLEQYVKVEPDWRTKEKSAEEVWVRRITGEKKERKSVKRQERQGCYTFPPFFPLPFPLSSLPPFKLNHGKYCSNCGPPKCWEIDAV